MNIIICRHGETDGNKIKNKILGRSDDSLNAEGARHAETVAKKIEGWKAEIIFSSETKRALQTAEIISDLTGLPIQQDSRLNEYDFGNFTGRVIERREIYREIEEAREKFKFKVPGGESDEDVVKRIKDFADELVKNNRNVVVCTHSYPAFVLKNILLGRSVTDFINLPFENMEHDEIVVIKK